MKTKPAGELAERIRLQEQWVSSLGKRGSKLCLEGDDLSGIDLAGADLNGAELRGVVLDDADLSGADLGGPVLAGCSFRRANLSGSLLAKSNVDYASLRVPQGSRDPARSRERCRCHCEEAGADEAIPKLQVGDCFAPLFTT